MDFWSRRRRSKAPRPSAGTPAASRSDGCVTFTSSWGGSFVAPSTFTAEESGKAFTLHPPGGHAVINAFRSDADGWDFNLFKCTVVAGVGRESSEWTQAEWQPTDWEPVRDMEIEIGGRKAVRMDLTPIADVPFRWRLYAIATIQFYFGIVLKASDTAMRNDGEFYEGVIRSFKYGTT